MHIKKLLHNKNDYFTDPLIIKTNIFRDSRGLFFESWNKKIIKNIIGEEIEFVQDNLSISAKGVLRGIHYQLPNMEQGKLVRCTKGSIFDVIVDLRKSSKTFKCWGGINLNSENNYQIWIPCGFGHGFLSLQNESILEYKVTNYWSKENEKTLIWNDKTVNIKWPFVDGKINLSTKDQNGSSLEELDFCDGLFK